MKNCIKCSHVMEDNQRFCPDCGTDNGMGEHLPKGDQPKKKERTKLPIILISVFFVIIIALLCAILFFLLNDDSSSDEDTSQHTSVAIQEGSAEKSSSSSSSTFSSTQTTSTTARVWGDRPETTETTSGVTNPLFGVYKSESGKYRIEFETDGSCRWYQDNTFFVGSYRFQNGRYILEIIATANYISTVFDAAPSGDDLIINGGVVYGERFVKQ